MKRSFSQVGKGGAGTSTPTTPGMTRAFSHGSAPVSTDAPVDSTLHLLQHQNKELMLALKSKKRSVSDLRSQLQYEKQQTAVATDLLSVLDRSYNQFHDDITRMISVLTSPSAESETSAQSDAKSKEWLSLLQAYLESGDCYFNVAPVQDVGMVREEGEEEEEGEGHQGQDDRTGQQVNLLRLRPDDWTSAAEIEESRLEALQQLQDQGKGDSNDNDNYDNDKGEGGEDMEIDEDDITRTPQSAGSSGGGADVLARGTAFSCHDRVVAISSELSRRTRSIKAKLHTLLKALQAKLNTSALSSSPITQSMAQTRHLRAEKLLLTELLAKYKVEIINLQAEVKFGERRLLLQERAKFFAPAGQTISSEQDVGHTAGDTKPNVSVGAGVASSALGDDKQSLAERSSSVPVGTDSGSKLSENGGTGELTPDLSTKQAAERSGDDPTVIALTLKQQQEAAAELKEARDRQEELQLLVSVLQEQVTSTDELRSAAEQALALYIHHTVASPGTLNDDVLSKLPSSQRAAMEQRWSREAQELEKARVLLQETQRQNHEKLTELEVEKNQYFRRLSELELAMSALTQASTSRIAEVTEQMEKQMETTKQEKEKAVASLRSIEQELQMFELTKTRLVEAETVEASTKRQCEQLSARIKAQSKTAELSDQNLALSRKREEQLTSQLAAAAMCKEQQVRQVAYDARLKQLQDEAEEGMIPEESDVDISQCDSVKRAQQECHKALTSLVTSTQARVDEVTAELADAKENMNDLILEIESVANEEERSREHNARLVKQLGETQGAQKEMRMENLRLHQEIQELNEKNPKLKQEMTRLRLNREQQEDIIKTLEDTAHKLRYEVHQLNGSLVTANITTESRSREREEAVSQCARAESETAECRRKISELKTRCGELSKQHDAERKQRLAAERKLSSAQSTIARLKQEGSGDFDEGGTVSSPGGSSSAASRASSGGQEGEGTQQQQMLDMTLNMLRCSVCHDRFKEVAITRCFHLFCKPCIDKNLSSRHRKCPACGERFGQDDVKSVYFTH